MVQFDGTVYTFGFGSDHDASMLEAISTQGGGMYYYIDSFEKVQFKLKSVQFYEFTAYKTVIRQYAKCLLCYLFVF